MNTISNILYWISTGLLVPVIVLLIFFFIRSLILIGSFFGQYMVRRATSNLLDARIRTLKGDEIEHFVASLPTSDTSLVVNYLHRMVKARDSQPQLEMLISDYELDADKNISTSKMLTKIGPILGLMGTLIPMGPALVGLASGDIASMAYNMQVAFSTTVVGLVVSLIGFVTQQAKERWAFHDLTILEFMANSLNNFSSPSTSFQS